MPHQITVIRNGKTFGPYSPQQAIYYIQKNKLFLNDFACLDNDTQTISLQSAIAKTGEKIPSAQSPLLSIQKIGSDFIFPWASIKNLSWLRDSRFIMLAITGLFPLALAIFANSSMIYIGLAGYASLLWGIFFFSLFKTDQINLNVCIRTIGITFILVIGLLLLHSIFSDKSSSPAQTKSVIFPFFSMFFRVGLPEEFCKALGIILLVRKLGVILKPQTVVFYGLISGLAFGVYEGVLYQIGINKHLNIDTAYYLNVLRLTSLPFLHATWCGIASYFIAFSAITPAHRNGLLIIGILIPAVLHALYNSMGIFSILPAVVSVLLLLIYLAKTGEMKNRITNP